MSTQETILKKQTKHHFKMTFQELKTWFRASEIPTEYVLQVEVYIQSVEILIAKHGDNISKHPHATHCKRELQNIYNQITKNDTL